MKLSTLKSKFVSSAALVATGIKTVKVGYLTETSGQEQFEMIIIVPPKIVGYDSRMGKKDWKITLYHVALDQNTDHSRALTSDERVTKWDSMVSTLKTLLAKICDDSGNYQLVGTMDIDLNSAGPQMLIAEAVIWVQVDLTLRTNDCND